MILLLFISGFFGNLAECASTIIAAHSFPQCAFVQQGFLPGVSTCLRARKGRPTSVGASLCVHGVHVAE